jgi:hypothetical protein
MNESMSDRLSWIRSLAKAEDHLESMGTIDLGMPGETLESKNEMTLAFVNELKNSFIEASSSFNELKGSALGRIKVYGIAKTQADFMLFRNGFKMIFSAKAPGVVAVRFNFLNPQYLTHSMPIVDTSAVNNFEENIIELKLGVFGDQNWMHKNEVVQKASIVRYHLSLFIKESSK